jgi:hypothetical protein
MNTLTQTTSKDTQDADLRGQARVQEWGMGDQVSHLGLSPIQVI